MRFLNRFHRVSLPFAELLLVAALFWGVVCGNVMMDVMGTVIFRSRSLAQGWSLVQRGFERPTHLSNPENLFIFSTPTNSRVLANERTDQNVTEESSFHHGDTFGRDAVGFEVELQSLFQSRIAVVPCRWAQSAMAIHSFAGGRQSDKSAASDTIARVWNVSYIGLTANF